MRWVGQQVSDLPASQNGFCMAACAAMVSNSTLEDVRNSCRFRFNQDDNMYYIPDKEIICFLAKRHLVYGLRVSIPADSPVNAHWKEFNCTIPLSLPAILTVKSERFEGKFHAVVWDPEIKMVRDPQFENPRFLTEFTVTEWMPISEI